MKFRHWWACVENSRQKIKKKIARMVWIDIVGISGYRSCDFGQHRPFHSAGSYSAALLYSTNAYCTRDVLVSVQDGRNPVTLSSAPVIIPFKYMWLTKTFSSACSSIILGCMARLDGWLPILLGIMIIVMMVFRAWNWLVQLQRKPAMSDWARER